MDLSHAIETFKGLEKSSPIAFLDRREQYQVQGARTGRYSTGFDLAATIPPSRQLAAPVVYEHSGYLFPCFDSPDSFRDGVLTAENNIRGCPGLHAFDFIACRGVSGLAFAAPLALLLHKPLAVIRKGERREAAHSYRNYEGPLGLNRYLIVDDIVDSGTTLKKIRASVYYVHNQKQLPQPHVVGVYLYGAQAFRKPHYYVSGLIDPLTPYDFCDIEDI